MQELLSALSVAPLRARGCVLCVQCAVLREAALCLVCLFFLRCGRAVWFGR